MSRGKIKKRHFNQIFLRKLTKLFLHTAQYLKLWLVHNHYNSGSIWRPPSLLHTLYMRIMFCYTRSITPGVCWISCAAPRTRTGRSSTVSTGFSYTENSCGLTEKKSSGLTSGDRVGLTIGPPWPIHLYPKHRLRWSLTVPAKWGTCSSCLN